MLNDGDRELYRRSTIRMCLMEIGFVCAVGLLLFCGFLLRCGSFSSFFLFAGFPSFFFLSSGFSSFSRFVVFFLSILKSSVKDSRSM